MLEVGFLSPANNELDEAATYYDHQLPGLDFRFFQEVASSGQTNKVHAGSVDENRRAKQDVASLKVFLTHFLNIIETEEIFITAVAHLHRYPEYYKDRII